MSRELRDITRACVLGLAVLAGCLSSCSELAGYVASDATARDANLDAPGSTLDQSADATNDGVTPSEGLVTDLPPGDAPAEGLVTDLPTGDTPVATSDTTVDGASDGNATDSVADSTPPDGPRPDLNPVCAVSAGLDRVSATSGAYTSVVAEPGNSARVFVVGYDSTAGQPIAAGYRPCQGTLTREWGPGQIPVGALAGGFATDAVMCGNGPASLCAAGQASTILPLANDRVFFARTQPGPGGSPPTWSSVTGTAGPNGDVRAAGASTGMLATWTSGLNIVGRSIMVSGIIGFGALSPIGGMTQGTPQYSMLSLEPSTNSGYRVVVADAMDLVWTYFIPSSCTQGPCSATAPYNFGIGAPPTAAASRGTIVIAFAGSSSGLKVGRFDTGTATSPTLDTIATLKDFEPRRARYVTSSLVVVVGADSSNRPSAAVVDISTTTLQLVYLHTASGTGAFHDVTVLGSMLVFVGESAGSAALWRCPSMSPCI